MKRDSLKLFVLIMLSGYLVSALAFCFYALLVSVEPSLSTSKEFVLFCYNTGGITWAMLLVIALTFAMTTIMRARDVFRLIMFDINRR